MGGERRRAGPGIPTPSFQYECNLEAREAVLADWQVYPSVHNYEKALGMDAPYRRDFFSFCHAVSPVRSPFPTQALGSESGES